MRKVFIRAKRCVAVLSCMAVMLAAAGCSDSDKKDDNKDRTTTQVNTEATTEGDVTVATSEGTVTEATTEATTADTTTEATTEESTIALAFSDPNTFIDEYPSFEVSSDSLHDSIWDDVISNTTKGENKSPQLSWEPVEGATVYLIYMTDLSASDWMHWKSNDVTETSLAEGWAAETEYVGPYPPPGPAHTYEIYVVALKNPVGEMQGTFDNRNAKFEDAFRANDIDADGNSGNIIAVGRITGYFADTK